MTEMFARVKHTRSLRQLVNCTAKKCFVKAATEITLLVSWFLWHKFFKVFTTFSKKI